MIYHTDDTILHTDDTILYKDESFLHKDDTLLHIYLHYYIKMSHSYKESLNS